jgi:hypothetical protein
MLNTSEPFPGWPSGGDRPVIYLTLTADEARERFKIDNWVNDFDKSLNTPIKIAYFLDEIIGPVVLVHYNHPEHIHTNARIEINVDKAVNVELATSRLVDLLALQESDIAGILNTSDFIDLREA